MYTSKPQKEVPMATADSNGKEMNLTPLSLLLALFEQRPSEGGSLWSMTDEFL
jgi:hypothetical protein